LYCSERCRADKSRAPSNTNFPNKALA
jgi:hypothetical protein